MSIARVESYPIEVQFPEIRAHAAGSHGVAYAWSFDGGAPGPHALVNALTHGNEVCGAIVVDELLRHALRPRRGRLSFCFANVDAYHSFDRARPDAARFLDQDFNRVWSADKLDNPELQNRELARARALRPLFDSVDLLLDLHSMHERGAPLLLSGPLDKGIAFARQVGTPQTIIVDQGHAEGRRLRDYSGFGDPASARNALLAECGQHWERAAIHVARNCVARFLLHSGVIDVGDLPDGWLQPQLPQRVVRVTEAVVARSSDFRFAAAYTGLEHFPKAGSVIGWNAGEAVITPYDDCVLVMPSLRQLRPGVTVVRLGKLEL